MATENRRIATYLPRNIDERLAAFKSERSIKGDSQALITILSEFFEVSQEVTHQSSSIIIDLQNRIETLEEKLVHTKDELLSKLRKELLEYRSDSIEQAKAEVRSELLSELKSELPRTEAIPGQLELLSRSDGELLEENQQIIASETPKSSNANQTFTTGELAKRLGIDSSTVSHWKPTGRRSKTPETLLEVTREKDPDGIGWIYLSDIKRFQPERNISSELPEDPESEPLGNTEF